jgi:hypothetical protein
MRARPASYWPLVDSEPRTVFTKSSQTQAVAITDTAKLPLKDTSPR